MGRRDRELQEMIDAHVAETAHQERVAEDNLKRIKLDGESISIRDTGKIRRSLFKRGVRPL